jgi:hypothetical protein
MIFAVNVSSICLIFFQLKQIFREATGDLVLGLCEILNVSWQIMIDDKISEFVSLCSEYSEFWKAAHQQDAQIQTSEKELSCISRIVSWFKREQGSHSDLDCSWLDANGVLQSGRVDFFDVFLNLASVSQPSVSNMASKLSIQLHSFPSNLFCYLQQTDILLGRDNFLIKQLESRLQTLVRTQHYTFT